MICFFIFIFSCNITFGLLWFLLLVMSPLLAPRWWPWKIHPASVVLDNVVRICWITLGFVPLDWIKKWGFGCCCAVLTGCSSPVVKGSCTVRFYIKRYFGKLNRNRVAGHMGAYFLICAVDGGNLDPVGEVLCLLQFFLQDFEKQLIFGFIVSGCCWSCNSVLGLQPWTLYSGSIWNFAYVDVWYFLDNRDVAHSWRYIIIFFHHWHNLSYTMYSVPILFHSYQIL